VEGLFQILADGLFLVLLIGAGVIYFTHSPESGIRRAAPIAGLLGLIGLLGALSAIIVPAGNVGVVTAFGAVQNDTLPPGIHFRVPFINSVHLITTRVQPHEFKEIDAASEEYQTVKLTGVMNYHVDGSFASYLYQTVGDDFASKVLDPAFSDFIKSVVPTYHIGDILGKRDEIRGLAKDQLQANLSKYHIIIDDIYIANISFSPEYEAAIEAKQVAQQQVQTEQQILAQKQIKAQQAVIDAQGSANAAIESAKGTAEANKLITQSLSPLLIQYQYILKLNPNVSVIYVPQSGNFLLNIADGKTGGTQP